MSYANGTSGDDQVILGTTLTPSNIYDAKDGNDTVIGSAGLNLILGGAGNDHLDGRGGSDVILGQDGADVIRGGAGLDIVDGGAGNDTFVFHAGDLTGSAFLPDVVLGFRGAGNSTAGTEQDVLVFHGFSAGSTLQFVSTVGGATQQLYKVNDAANPSASGYVLISTDTAAHLNAGDVHFAAKPTEAVTLDFEDVDASDPVILDGYHGFNFDAGGRDLNAVDKDDFPNSGYHTAIDGEIGVYNPFGADPLVVTRSDGSDFVFDKVQIAAAADTSQVVTFKGYSDGFEVGSITATIAYGVPTLVDADWGVIDKLVIDRVSTTGDHSPFDDIDGSQFVLDNFHFVVADSLI